MNNILVFLIPTTIVLLSQFTWNNVEQVVIRNKQLNLAMGKLKIKPIATN